MPEGWLNRQDLADTQNKMREVLGDLFMIWLEAQSKDCQTEIMVMLIKETDQEITDEVRFFLIDNGLAKASDFDVQSNA